MLIKDNSLYRKRNLCFGIGMGTATALGAGASLVSGLLGAGANIKAVRETNKTNLQLAREQQDWNLQQWQRENSWNSAAAQLQRWTDAGLNPNSFVGSNQSEAQHLESPDLANQQAPNVGELYQSVGRSIQDGLMQAAIQAQNYSVKQQELDLRSKELALEGQKFGLQQKLTESELQTAEKIRKNMEATWDKIVSETNLNKERANEVRAQLPLLSQQFDMNAQRLSQLTIQSHMMNLEFKFHKATFNTRINQAAANLAKTWSEVGLNKQMAEESLQRICLMGYDKQIKSQQIDLLGTQITLYRTQNGTLNFKLNLDRKNAQRIIDHNIFVDNFRVFNDLMRTGASVVQTFMNPIGNSSLGNAFLGGNSSASWNSPISTPQSWSVPNGMNQFY